MSDQVVVDEADLWDVYSQMPETRARSRMRRLLFSADDVEEAVDAEQARAEGFAAGLFMAGLVSMGTFEGESSEHVDTMFRGPEDKRFEEEEEPATMDEAIDHLQPQFNAGVIHAGRHSEQDLYVAANDRNDIQEAIEETDVPAGWTAKGSDMLPAIKFYGPENEAHNEPR